jgi:predicted P-loop ATPase
MKKHEVTFFRNVMDKSPVIDDIITIVKKYHCNSTPHRERVQKIQTETDPEKRDKMKRSLPALCVGSKLVGGGAAINVTEKLPTLFIDIDTESTDEAKRIKEEAIKEFSAFALFIGLSVSGTGVHIVLLVEDPNNKLAHWKAVIKQYKERWPIDESTNDVDTRKAFIGCDPEAFINESDDIMPFTAKEVQQIAHMNALAKVESVDDDYKSMLNNLFTKSKAYEEGFQDGKRNAFICSIGYRSNRLGIPVELLIQELNERVQLSNFPEHLQKLHYIYKNKSSEFGTQKPRKFTNEDDENWLQVIEQQLSKHSFRYNIVLNQLEYFNDETLEYGMMTDYVENSILRDLWQHGIKCDTSRLRIILHSDFSPIYNPFEEYFYGLPAWDGATDYIQQLADTVKTTNQDFWSKVFRKWLVAMVGSALHDKIVNHTVLILCGEQGLGKSTWLINLIPDSLKKYVYSGTINPDNKDTLAHIAECLLINLDELENLNKTELGSLKDLITKMLVRYRRPYGHNNENYPRRATFAGSVNNNQFLSDFTGSRRFLSNEATAINYQHNISLDMVYAQALHLFKNGFKHWFDKEEITEINEMNEKHRLTTPEEELLLLYYVPDESEYPEMTFTTTQLADRLATNGGLKSGFATINTLGKALRKHKFPRIKKGELYVYKMKMRHDSPEMMNQAEVNKRLSQKNFDEVEPEKKQELDADKEKTDPKKEEPGVGKGKGN